MKLKSVSMCVALLLSAGCANQTAPFGVAKFYALGPGCDAFAKSKDEGATIANGYLDVAAGNAQYFVGVHVSAAGREAIIQNEVAVGTTLLEQSNRNRPQVNQMVVNYRLSKRVGATPRPYITNFLAPFEAGSGELFRPIQIISPELATALFDGLTPSPGVAPSAVIEDFVDIIANVEFRGEFGATRHPFSTGSLGLPIRAYRSNPVACANGYIKFKADMGGILEPCDYIGQTTLQLRAPLAPSLCCASPGGGAGC